MVDLPEHVRQQLVQLLSEHPEVAQAILFGSRSRGDAAPRSDIDLAIVAPTATSRQWLDWPFCYKRRPIPSC
jgi:predicted nucleotidyltransferase